MDSQVTILHIDTEVIARRISVVDMLRGVALILLTLGCVLVWFCKAVRISARYEGISVMLTHYLAEAGALGIMFILGMSIFFFWKYHFSIEKYNVIITSVAILVVYSVFFYSPLFSLIVQFSFWIWMVTIILLFGSGWIAGYTFQNRLLLDADEYAIYMGRKHDFRKVMLVFGQSPLFFFGMMLLLVHFLACLTVLSAGFSWERIHILNGYRGLPDEFGYSLPRIYLICFCILALLYPICKLYGNFKAAHPYGWLKYL